MNKPSSLHQKQEIVQHEQHLLEAIKHNDTNRLDTLLHEDLLFNIPNGQTITKAMDMETYRSGNMNISELSASEQTIHIIDDTAIVTVTIYLEGKYFDQPLNGKYRYIRVWKAFKDKWQVIAGSCIPL